MPAARTTLAALAAALFFAGVGATALLRPPWVEALIARLAPPPPAPARPADPLDRIPKVVRDMLTSHQPDAPSPFLRVTRVKPDEFCKGLAAAGLKNATFQQGAAPFRGWTCVTDLVKPIDGDEAKVSSLFVAVRGLESDRIDNLRMKLNLLDEETSRVVRAIARDTLAQICRSLGWDPPDEVMEALEELREGRVFHYGVSYDFRREFGAALRLNLMIIFPRTLGRGGEDRFVTDIRRQPVSR